MITLKENKERVEYTDIFFENDSKTREIIDAIKSLERFRMFLYKDAANYIALTESLGLYPGYSKKFYEALNKDEWAAEYNGKRIKIYIPDVPPTVYIKTRNKALSYFIELWKRKTQRILRKCMDTYNLKFDKIFTWIKCFNPVSEYDGDNKLIKPIIDGIARSGLIKDDTVRTVKYGFEGFCDRQNPHMEVYIFGDKNIPGFISSDIF